MLLLLLGRGSSALAHVGTLNVVYETQTPPVPVRVVIRPPGVVPGLADIDIRLLTNQPAVQRVTVLPVHWRAGLVGAPPPDVAVAVPGEPGLYHAELWLMDLGAYSVHVSLETATITNRFIVPVNSLATNLLPMTPLLGGILLVLGGLLFLLAASIAGAAVREGVLAPGAVPTAARRWAGLAAGLGAAAILALAIWGGRSWWMKEDRGYRNNKMHQPVPCAVTVRVVGTQRVLQLNVLTNEGRVNFPGLVPDHGKLMHVYLIQEPGMAALAHVHPVRKTHWQFEATLPPLPAGDYRVYADVTHESGYSQTLTAPARLPEIQPGSLSGAVPPVDPDDSAFTGQPGPAQEEADLGDGFVMKWKRPEKLVAGAGTALQFEVREAGGERVRLEPYMSMLGHAAVRREDGEVFMHLHPAGSASIAAQQVFQIRAGDSAPRRITPELMEKYCQLPTAEGGLQPLRFPYEFPKGGRYRIWVQVKLNGRVRTGVFDAQVQGAH